MLRNASNHFRALRDYRPPKIPWASVPKRTRQREIHDDERRQLIEYLRFEGLHENEKPSSRIARFEYGDMLELALATSMRWGEIAKTMWTMINFAQKFLILPEEITKTGESRIVYLNSQAIAILLRRKETSKNSYVFPDPTGKTHRTYYYEGIKRACKKLGLPFGRDIGFTLHSARHTAISELLRRTGDFAGVQAQAGQSDQTMTSRYAHASERRMLDLVESLVEKPEK